ncbi:hypothetical protein AB0G02_27800 [Actinosynnema sp. NPDC023658]|uniref:hypothetical protein n=1 Tax=Actinosynnema sp. NPDC023658 TaxID=3155465 RepID=UPI0033D5A8A4
MLVVDVRHFSKHNSAEQQVIAEQLPEILQRVADRTNLTSLWERGEFKAFRGDGYVIGFDPNLISAVVDGFFDALQSELRLRAAEFRAAGIELRVRASLHLGPLTSFNRLLADSPSGRPVVEANRMVDAEAVRALLDNSDPEVTFVALVLSHSVMEHVVEAGSTTRRRSEFVEAPLDVTAKEYSGKGYLRVPVPSGDLLRYGLLHGQPEAPPDDDRAVKRPEAPGHHVSNHMGGTAHNLVQAGSVRGGIHSHLTRNTDKGIEVTGNGNVTAGSNVDQSSGKQEFSGNFHTAGDANFGPSSGRRAGHDTAPEAG